MASDFTEKKIASRAAYRGRLLQLNEDEVELPGGGRARREYVVHPGAALILPLFEDGSVLLERQFRYPAGDHFYELPAGKFDPGESPLETARRELLEETGYVAAEWRALGKLHPCIGYSNEVIELFVARKLEVQGGQRLDEGEFLEILRLPLQEAVAWVRSGRINDMKTMLGLLMAEKIAREDW